MIHDLLYFGKLIICKKIKIVYNCAMGIDLKTIKEELEMRGTEELRDIMRSLGGTPRLLHKNALNTPPYHTKDTPVYSYLF